MSSSTILYIILAFFGAALLSGVQYFLRAKRSSLNVILALIRFVTYFLILLLLINPKFEKVTFYNEKPNLVIAIDNSESVKHLEQTSNVNDLVENIQTNDALNEAFDVDYYTFGDQFQSMDSITFSDSRSHISEIFPSIDQVYKNKVAPLILISDGNQTYGNDYQFVASQLDQPLHTVVLGDTITYADLKIQRLNVNKYAYLKNKFPVEIFINYSGNQSVSSQLTVTSSGSRIYNETLNFSKTNNSQVVTLNLDANTIGVNTFVATISPLDIEKNKVNNSKPFAVEVIDQKTNVALISTIVHPDLGALKKSIESNEQRTVSIISPSDYIRTKDNYQLVILYQPNNLFNSVFETLSASNSNAFVITGSQTQWSFLNQIQDNYQQEITGQTEDFQAESNSNYNTFIVDDLNFNSFPPLTSEFGQVIFNTPIETLLYKRVNNTILPDPLLFTFEENNRREAVLLGENIWRWRAQSYLNSDSFQEFDNFIGKLVQYLISNQQKRRLNVSYESFYDGNGNIVITSQFFNKNYEFDNKANLELILNNQETGESRTLPFVIKQINYQVDISDLAPGAYNFTVRANGNEATQSGSFTILDYNVEQQFLNADVNKLQSIAHATEGKSYFINNVEQLIPDLIADSRFATIQKSTKNVVPLIDFKLILALIALSLATEWFIRKYNGLI